MWGKSMDVVQLRQQILLRKVDNLYIFTGSEITVQQIYIEQIGKFMNKTVKYIDNISDICKSSGSLFAKESYCYVSIDNTDFVESEKTWDTIKSILSDNILIIWLNKLDKRSKFYKHFKDVVIEFEHMNDNLLVQYIQKEINLSERNCITLIQACDSNYDRILSEIDKIKSYRDGYSIDKQETIADDGAFTHLLSSGTIHSEKNNVVYDYIDAMVTGRIDSSLKLLDDCIANADSVVGVLTMLYNNFKMMLQVQACNSSNIEDVTGLSDWEVKRTKAKIGAYSIGEIVNAIKLIRDVETKIKQGMMSEVFALPYVTVQILG